MDFKITESFSPTEDPILRNALDLFRQEISILFSGSPTDVFGNDEDWVDIEKYVFKTNVNASTLESKISNAISRYCPSSEDFTFKVEVKFIRGELSDIGLIDVHIFSSEDVNKKVSTFRAAIGY